MIKKINHALEDITTNETIPNCVARCTPRTASRRCQVWEQAIEDEEEHEDHLETKNPSIGGTRMEVKIANYFVC